MDNWTHETVLAAARLFDDRIDFQTINVAAYRAAKRFGILDDVCAHMHLSDDDAMLFRPRFIYAYVFHKENKVYVGMTGDLQKRRKCHASPGGGGNHGLTALLRSGVAHDILSTPTALDFETAADMEGIWLAYFMDCGFEKLNQTPTGGLGGYHVKWTEARIYAAAKLFTGRNAFCEGNRGAYYAAQGRGILDDVCSHMVPVQISWDYDSIKLAAAEYDTRLKFVRGNAKAYRVAYRWNILDDVCSHMEQVLISWDYESIKLAAAEYDTRTAFNKGNPKAYAAARRHDVLDDVCSRMTGYPKRWDYDSILLVAQQYATFSEFKKGNGPAYAGAVRLGIIMQVCQHMPGV